MEAYRLLHDVHANVFPSPFLPVRALSTENIPEPVQLGPVEEETLFAWMGRESFMEEKADPCTGL